MRVEFFGDTQDEVIAKLDHLEQHLREHTRCQAFTRALTAGIRTIEHGNLLDAPTAELFGEKQAYLVMNLVTYWALQTEGRENGLPEASWIKVSEVLDGGLKALELAHATGIQIGYGTDLLGGMHRHQSQEFVIRSQVQAPIDVIRSATTVGAEIVGMPGKLGTLEPGAVADLVVLKRDPLEDIAALADPAALSYVVKGGKVELAKGFSREEIQVKPGEVFAAAPTCLRSSFRAAT